jgi:hypothetical protein
MSELNVGDLRQQSALCKLLGGKKIVALRCYPDTTDENGKWNSTFKIRAVVCSADNFFMNDGVYQFDPAKLGNAHTCFRTFETALQRGEDD